MEANFICTSCDEPCEESEVNEKGECPYCAGHWECVDCNKEFGEDDTKVSTDDGPVCSDCAYDRGHCDKCDGTGEGMVDGSHCTKCGGSGQLPVGSKDDFDPPDPDDNFTTDRDYGPWGYEG